MITLLDVNVSNTTLLTVALVLFIICAVVWLIGGGIGRFRR